MTLFSLFPPSYPLLLVSGFRSSFATSDIHENRLRTSKADGLFMP